MANEVGRVHVRVLPKTDGFALRTKAKLKALKEQTYKVPVDIDTAKFQRDLELMVRRAQAWAHRKENRIVMRTKLDISKRDARGQVQDTWGTYQELAETQRDVKFSSSLDASHMSAQVPVTPSIDEGSFMRDLGRAVRRATRDHSISIWGDRQGIELQADRAASIFRDRLEYANREITMFGDTARIEEAALQAARSTKERLRDALKDFNIFGAPKDIEDQTSDALDVFKRKWKEAQGELNIRADLELDKQKLQESIDLVEELTLAHSKGVDKLNDHIRGYRGMVEQIKKNRIAMMRLQGEMDRMDKSAEDYAERWTEASERQREHGRSVERLKDSVDTMAEKLRTLKMEVELDATDLVDAEAELERFRAQAELHDIELNTDIKTAASEAALAFLTRPRVAEIRTRISNSTRAAINDLRKVGGIDWGDIGRVIGSFGTRSTGIRMLWQTARDIVDIVPRLDMMIPKLAQTVVLATAAIAGAGGALASMVSIGSDMMRVANLALIAPAGLAGISVMALVFASAWKSMEQYAPGIEAGFTSLQDTLGADFWEADGGRVSGFLESVFASLEKYSPRLTQSVADATAALADGLYESGIEQGPRFMENLMRGLKDAEGGFKAFGSAMMGLIGAGSDSFESLGQWFTRTMEDFDDWVKRNDANGNITRWINEGAQALQDIGSIIYSTGSMFRTLGEIVKEAGGPSLSDFAEGMRQLSDAMKGPGFRGEALPTLESMFAFLGELSTLKPQAMEATANALEMIRYALDNLSGPITTIFGATLDGFNSPIFMAGFEQFIDGMGSFLTDIAPGWERFVAELGGLFGVVGEGAKSFGPAFNELLLLVSNIGSNIHPGLEDFLRFVGPELEDFVSRIRPGLEDIATGVSDLLANKGFQEFLSDIADNLGFIAEKALDAANGILDLINALATEYEHAPEWIKDLATWTIALGGAALFTAPLLKPLLAPLGALLSIFKTPIKNMARNGLLGAVDRLSKIKWGNLWRGIGTGVAGGARGLLPRLLGVFSGPVGWGVLIADFIKPLSVARIGSAILDALGLGDSWAADLLDWVSGKFEEIFGDASLLELGSPLINAFSKAWDGAIEGWSNGGIFGAVEGALSGFGDGISDSFQMLWEVIKGALTDGVDYIVEKFQNWEPTSDIGKAYKYIVEAIPGLFGFDESGAWSWGTLTSSWKEFGSTAWREIKDWLNGQVDKIIEDWNAWEPTTKTGRAVKSIVETVRGLMGFTDEGWSWDTLTSSWKDFASDAWSSIKSWLDEQIDKLWGEISEWTPVKKTLDFVEGVADWIAELFGYEDFDDALESIEDWWEDLEEEVDRCLNNAWSNFKDWLGSWAPAAFVLVGGIPALIGGWVAKLLGIDEGWAWDCDDLRDFWDTAWKGLKKWLQDQWEALVKKIQDWKPVAAFFDAVEFIGGLIAKLFRRDDESTPDSEIDFWPMVKKLLQEKWEDLIEEIKGWKPVKAFFDSAKWVGEKLRELFGKNDKAEDSEIDFWPMVKKFLQKKWEDLIEDIRNWKPVRTFFDSAKWVGNKLRELFGKNEEPNAEIDFWPMVKKWLQEKWDGLIEDIRNWKPIQTAFDFGSWLWGKIRELFGKDDGTDDQDLVDWEKWEGRLKKALTIGLVGLVAAITAPLWVPIAPLVLGPLIIKWLFGDGEDEDEEGTKQTLIERVKEWWGPIKEALTEGIEELGRGVGGLIHDAICLPQYILDEVFTDCFDEGGMFSRAKERVVGWGGPIIQGVSEGITGIADRLKGLTIGGEGLPAPVPGNGLMDRLLGTTTPNVEGTLGNLGRIGAGAATFASGVLGSFGTMGSGTRREIAGLTDNTEAEFGDMKKSSQGDARAMNSGVVGQFLAMNLASVAQAANLRTGAVRALADTKSGAVAEGRAANQGFVAQMSDLARMSLSIARGLAGTMPGALRINAGGSGRYTGQTYVSGLASGLSRAAGVARGFAGSIRSALSFSAYSSGSTVGGTFASGIRSRIGSAIAAANALASAVRNRMPRSPAKEGPFSGSGWGGWGESIADELARGLRMGAPAVAKEAEAMMSSVHGALDSRSDLEVGVDFERSRRRHSLVSDAGTGATGGTEINVNVESRSEDPLQDGNRFGGDIAFALRGAGLA